MKPTKYTKKEKSEDHRPIAAVPFAPRSKDGKLVYMHKEKEKTGETQQTEDQDN